MESSMKVHQFARGFWVHEPSSLTLGCKRLRPLVPKHSNNNNNNSSSDSTITAASFDLKSFIRPQTVSPTKTLRRSEDMGETTQNVQVETQPGGTRWNPTTEQIGILEMLYRGGMRTPNAEQIEQITAQLGKYGKIEGKNVFYWFQNHKARERQKQKRNSASLLGLGHCTRSIPATTIATITLDTSTRGQVEREEESPNKRKCRTWVLESLEEDKRYCKEEGDKTLELFPLHPEGR